MVRVVIWGTWRMDGGLELVGGVMGIKVRNVAQIIAKRDGAPR